MDPNQSRDPRFYFSLPNDHDDQQILNTANQPSRLTGARPNVLPPVWDWNPSALDTDLRMATSPSTAPASLSFAQSCPSTAPTSLATNPITAPHMKIGKHGQSFPTRTPSSREIPERKRSKLSADPSPFDSIDYWIRFDNDETPPAITETTIPVNADPMLLDASLQGDNPSTQRASKATSLVSSQPQLGGFRAEQYADDDSALDKALSDEDDGFSSINLADQLSMIDSAPPSEIPPREGLYSTPLSWEQPQPGIQMDYLIGPTSYVMSEAERRRLIAIAMNPSPNVRGLGATINMPSRVHDSGLDPGGAFPHKTASTRQGVSTAPPPKPLPRHQQWTGMEEKEKEKNKGKGKEKEKEKEKEKGARAAHNHIERKYRSKLNNTISELRDAVPSLQKLSEAEAEGAESSRPARGSRINKGTILEKATEYIQQLERTNREMTLKNQELRQRLQVHRLQAFGLLSATTIPLDPPAPLDHSRTLFDPRGFC